MNGFKNAAGSPLLRLLVTTVGAVWVLKAITLVLRGGPRATTGLLVFLLAWPGAIPDSFRDRHPPQIIDPARFLAARTRMAVGALSIFLLAV